MSRNGRCEHGRMLKHAPEPTTSTAATSGRPCGLHPTASHTGGMVAPFDPGVRAARVYGFTFGEWDSRSSTLQVHAENAGINRIAGVLMGKILVILHFPPAWSVPPLYSPWRVSPGICTRSCGNGCASKTSSASGRATRQSTRNLQQWCAHGCRPA